MTFPSLADGEREFFEFEEKVDSREQHRPRITKRDFPMEVLIYGSGKESIRERAAHCFTAKRERAREIVYYQFGRLNMICEPVSSSVFTEVLYADGIIDVLDYCVRACIMEEYPERRCKNCGKWFILKGHQQAIS